LLAGVLVAASFAASAQESKKKKIYRIDCIQGGPLTPRAHQWAAFRRGLRELGHLEGDNIALEFREPKEGIAADDLIADLIKLEVDVIVASTAIHVHSARRATKTIPIAMTGLTDPVAAGVVTNLARPDGNVTGLSFLPVELVGKRLELMLELLPKSKRIAMLWNPNDPVPQLKAATAAGQKAGVEIVSVEARAAKNLGPAIETVRSRGADGLIIATSGLFYGLRDQILDLLQKAKLPAIWGWESFGAFGALLVYGPSDTDNYHRAATYVDRLLKGARPGDLPIEQPTQVKLVVNLRAARSLSIEIPKSLLVRADHVIK
jgi:putative ABC transport system substrate-binding protein